MEFYIKKTKTVKSQSILEYLIVLAAIFAAIIINTVGFSTGVQNSLGLQNSLNTTHDVIETGILDTNAPAEVTSTPYYTPPSEITSNPNNADTYGGPNYTGGYDYDTWIKNHPDSGYNTYNAPAPGPITLSSTNTGS